MTILHQIENINKEKLFKIYEFYSPAVQLKFF